MTKVRKQKRKKKFRVNVNRKRMRNKLRKLPSIPCAKIKQAWEATKSIRSNLNSMGLAYDPNEAIKIPNVAAEFVEDSKLKILEDTLIDNNNDTTEKIPSKIHILEALEAEAKAPKERMFRLPKGQVEFVTYFMDKYGEDFKAMARDKKNYNQLTWKQIRAKIKTFKGIPEQYNEYISEKNV